MTVRTMRTAAILAVLCAVAVGRLEWQYLQPSGRGLATVIIDTPNKRAVLFGGSGDNGDNNDVWTMPLGTSDGYQGWRLLSVSGTPPAARAGHAATFDPIHNAMVIFGGRSGGSTFSDVWSLDLGTATWQQVTPTGTPPPGRVYISAVYSAVRRSMIIIDGDDINQGYDCVYELLLDSMKWQEITPSGTHPEARWSYNVFLDPDSNRLIDFGGQTQSGQFDNDVWALSLTPGQEAWTQLSPTGDIPEGRSNCATAYDEDGHKAYFFGGFNYNQGVFYNDLYTLTMSSLTWTNENPGGATPVERRCAAGFFDSWNRNFISFGGQTYYDNTNEGLYVSVGTLGVAEWQGVEPGQSPSLRVTTVNSRQVSIRYSVPGSGTANLRIVDLSGRVIRNLLTGVATTGNRELVWDGRDEHGKAVASGSYFCYLETDRTGLSRKFVLSR